MPRSSGILAFPDFRGFTRKLILWNLGAFFVLLLLGVASAPAAFTIVSWTALVPPFVLHGRVWQVFTYSFVHSGAGDILNTAFQLLSLWFLGSFLESNHGSRWLAEIYFVSALGAGLAAMALYAAMLIAIGFGARDRNHRFLRRKHLKHLRVGLDGFDFEVDEGNSLPREL